MTFGTALFRLRVRVYWEDTDGSGIVYYANYLRFLERARSEWLRALGWQQSALAASERIAFVVRRIDARFLRPARLDDELDVCIAGLSLGAASIDISQWIERGDERLAQAGVQLACVNIDSFRPVRLPQLLRSALAARSSERPEPE